MMIYSLALDHRCRQVVAFRFNSPHFPYLPDSVGNAVRSLASRRAAAVAGWIRAIHSTPLRAMLHG